MTQGWQIYLGRGKNDTKKGKCPLNTPCLIFAQTCDYFEGKALAAKKS